MPLVCSAVGGWAMNSGSASSFIFLLSWGFWRRISIKRSPKFSALLALVFATGINGDPATDLDLEESETASISDDNAVINGTRTDRTAVHCRCMINMFVRNMETCLDFNLTKRCCANTITLLLSREGGLMPRLIVDTKK